MTYPSGKLGRSDSQIGRKYNAKLQHFFCQFRSKLAITHTIAIKWKEKYDAVVVDCHHSLCLCGDRMKKSLPIFFFFFRETPTSLRVQFRAKFQPLGLLFCPNGPPAYQWCSQNVKKIRHIKGRLLDQAVVLFNCFPFS